MKAGVSSYSFVRLVRAGAMTTLDIPAKAKEMGFDAVEFSSLVLPEGETKESLAPKIVDACRAADIPIASYTIGADFLNGSDGDLDAEVARVKTEVDVAKTLGVPTMRHDATRGYGPEKHIGRSFDAALPRLADGIRQVTEYAADLGVKTTIENHGFFCQDSVRVEKLVNAVNHENFGLLVDIGNFLCADDDPAKACGLLAPYAFHLHAKDFHTKPGSAVDPGDGWFQSRAGNYLRGAIIGHGDVPVVQCLRVMKKAGYDGVCSIEFEGVEEVLKGIEMGLKNLRRFIAMA